MILTFGNRLSHRHWGIDYQNREYESQHSDSKDVPAHRSIQTK